MFCDYLTLYQEHIEGCPKFDSGAVLSIDADGSVEWQTVRGVSVEGSHSTRLLVSSDGARVRLSGNVGRFGRPDNVFGYSVADCIRRANAIMRQLQLPEFAPGVLVSSRMRHMKGPESIRCAGSTGAQVTRLDLTVNYATGSQGSAQDYLNWLEGQQPGRLKACSYGEGVTVTWGYGSKYVSMKVYNKFEEIKAHVKASAIADVEMLGMLHNEGVVRGEVTLKSRYLRQKNLQALDVVLRTNWGRIYMEKLGHKLAPSAEVPEVHDIPNPYLGTFLAWRDGVDMASRLSRATFYRHRKFLLVYGFDIARTSNVRRLPIKVREIVLRPLSRPSWYWLDDAEAVKLAEPGQAELKKLTG